MALANYSDLTTAAANWLGRSDLSSRIPEGIVLAEAKINRKLRTKDMEVRNSAFPITANRVGLPTGFGGVVSFFLNTNPLVIVEFMPTDLITATYSSANSTGQPRRYCIESGSFRFGPTPDSSYTATLTYFLKVPALTSTANTNWLMTDHPDVYLYGVNAEMCALAKDWQAAQTWEQLMYNALGEIVVISNKDKWSGSQLVSRPG